MYSKKYKVIEYLTVICLAVAALSYFSGDLMATTYHSINLWNCIFDNQWTSSGILDFYIANYSDGMVYTISEDFYQIAAVYDLPLYCMFAMWNLPLWILQKFNVDIYNNFICLLWAKSLLILFFIGTAQIIKLIIEVLNGTRQQVKTCLWLFLTNNICLIVIFVSCQYDIVGIFFTLVGILFFLKGNKKFILWFAMATAFKYFALLVFVPILLIREKRITKIFYYVCCCLTITVMFKLPFVLTHRLAGAWPIQELVKKIIWPLGECGLGNVSLYGIVYLMICIYCYNKRCGIGGGGYTAIYSSSAVFLALSIFADIAPYWFILVIPYMCIIIVLNTDQIKTNLLLETAISGAFIWRTVCYPTGQCDMLFMARMFPAKLFGRISKAWYNTGSPFYWLISSTGTEGLLKILLNTVLVACSISFIVINIRKKDIKYEPTDHLEFPLDLLFIRVLSSVLYVFVPIGVYVYLIK